MRPAAPTFYFRVRVNGHYSYRTLAGLVDEQFDTLGRAYLAEVMRRAEARDGAQRIEAANRLRRERAG